MVESPVFCELSHIKVQLFVMQSLVRALPNYKRVFPAHTTAILLKNKDIVIGYDSGGERRS